MISRVNFHSRSHDADLKDVLMTGELCFSYLSKQIKFAEQTTVHMRIVLYFLVQTTMESRFLQPEHFWIEAPRQSAIKQFALEPWGPESYETTSRTEAKPGLDGSKTRPHFRDNRKTQVEDLPETLADLCFAALRSVCHSFRKSLLLGDFFHNSSGV